MHYHCEIGTRHDTSPIPVFKGHQTLKAMAPNELVRILASEDSARNFEAFAKSARYQVLHKETLAHNELAMVIVKTAHA